MKNSLSAILLGLALLSCTKEQVLSEPAVLSLDVNVSDAGRVQLDGTLNTVWNAGDSLSVFYKGSSSNGLWLYSGKDKSSSGTIKSTDYEYDYGSKLTYAVYPYSKSYALNSSSVNLTLPSVQRFVKGSFGYTVMAAKGSGSTLNFQYALSMVCLEVSGSAIIDSVKLRANASEVLCGPAVLDMSGARPLVSLESAATGKEIVMRGNGGAHMTTLKDTVERMFFSIPAGTYSKGFALELYYANGVVKKVLHSSSVTLTPGQYLMVKDFVNETIVLDLNFVSDPQTTSSILYYLPLSTKMAQSGTVDSVRTYSFQTSYSFSLWAKTGFCKQTAGSGARIVYLQFNPNSEGYAWFKIPAINGWILNEVDVTVATSSSSTLNISSSVGSDGAGLGDACAPVSMSSSSLTLKLASPKVATPYYLCTGYQKNTRISSVKFIYVRP